MSTFNFRPSARLQRYLGRELIADPNLAILEFVKNAYDANANNVYISFSFPVKGLSSLLISDDGSGMDEKSFEQNWMHPGFSTKSPDAKIARKKTPPSDGSNGRVPVGEKGLGRMAAGRLGASLEVFTRQNQSQPWLHVLFDWAKFDDMTKLMEEIAIEYDLKSEPEDPQVQSGTILIIRDLELKWDGRIQGRPVPGRRRTRLGRLKQDLQLLMRPLKATDAPFTIKLDSDSFLDPEDIGTITPTEAVEEADYIYDFEFRVSPTGHATIRRELRRSSRLVAELGGEPVVHFPSAVIKNLAAIERRPLSLTSGPFRGRFLYTPAPAAKRAREIDAIGSGVLLYRDKVLVEPYGLDNNDWLGVSARKAQRQGYALIQPNLFSGYVLINRQDNPELRDMSNRLGLLENEVSEEFIQHAQAEFSFFESLVFDELKERWESKESKAARQAEDAIDLAAIRLRAIAHSLGQPLTGLDLDITSLRVIAKKKAVPKEISSQLLELADSASEHLRQATRAVARFRDVPIAERTTTSARSLVMDAVKQVKPLAISSTVTIQIDELPADKNVFVHRELVVEAIAELLRNAIEAPRISSKAKEVNIGYHEDSGDFVLELRDNGTGIPGFSKRKALHAIESNKGRPGMGLSTVMEILAASLAKIQVVVSDQSGTRVDVFLPDRVSGLRQ